MQRVLVVFNPISGVRFFRPSQTSILRAMQRHDVVVTWVETSPHGTDAIHDALTHSFDRIVVIGGDGTIRDVAEILVTSNNKTPLAIIALGTGNMLASSLGIPLIPMQRAIRFALCAPAHAIDVFRINGSRISLIGAGQGYDTLFIRGATRLMKQRIGHLAYAWSFLRTFFPYRAKRYTIIVDGKRHQTMGKLVLALNIFSPIGIPIERAVSAHDGIIDVFVLNPRTVGESLWTAAAFVLRRPRNNIPYLKTFRGKRVSIRQQKGENIQVDGEIYNDKHLDIEIVPHALSIVHRTSFDGTTHDAYDGKA